MGAPAGSRERPGGVIRYLLDSSALWRILRDAALRAAWAEVVSLGVIGSCQPQRVEFRATAAHHDLAILHDDRDFAAAAQYLPDLRERSVHDTPEPG
jgi:predicted nucleic acid-binding protein